MNRLLRLVISLAFVVLVAACGGEESSVTTLPPQPGPVLEAAAEAMSNVDYVHFKILWAGGAPIGISDFNADFEDAEGFFAAPGAANGVATLAVGNAKAQLGVISIEGQTWLTEPISGAWMDAPSGFDIDPSSFFDPKGAWEPLLTDLTDVEFVGEEDRERGDVDPPPAPHIAESAHERHYGHVGDEVDVDDPGGIVDAVGQHDPEIVDDRPQHRGDDGQVVGGDEDAKRNNDEDCPRGYFLPVLLQTQISMSGGLISTGSPNSVNSMYQSLV